MDQPVYVRPGCHAALAGGGRRLRATVSYAALALYISACFGCASSPWKRELYEPANAGVAVYLESKCRETGELIPLAYSHPVKLSAGDLGGFLLALRFTEEEFFGGRTEDPLFTPEEVDRIAPALSRALGAVGKNQRVRFVSMRSTSRYSMFRVFDCTSAVVFATSPDTIHIAFDYIHEELAEETGDPEEVRLHREPTETLDDEFTIVAPAKVVHHRVGGREYPRWVTASPERVQAVAAAVAAASVQNAVAASAVATDAAPPVSTQATPRPTTQQATSPAKPVATTLAGQSSEPPVESAPQTLVPDFRGYAILQLGGRFYGLPKDSSNSDIAPSGVIQGESAAAVIESILAAEQARDEDSKAE